MMKALRSNSLVSIFLCFLAVSGSVCAVNINFDGELFDRSCEISPESSNQEVVFLERPVRDFWVTPGRGPAEKFSIKLINCNVESIWKIVKLKFTGNKETNMLGQSDYFLRVAGVNQGKLAVGILDTDGNTLLKLGDSHNSSTGTDIKGESVSLDFKAFVQATPDAISNKSVSPGEYTSIANFELFYE